MSALVLALPNFAKPFVIETDASETGIGVVLQQDGHPIAYVSKALGSKTQGLSTYEKESLAILLAIDQWKAYLQPVEFVINTDHKSLTHLSDQRLHTHWQQKVLTKLMSYQYKISYKKGTTNSVVDALSRLHILLLISMLLLWLNLCGFKTYSSVMTQMKLHKRC